VLELLERLLDQQADVLFVVDDQNSGHLDPRCRWSRGWVAGGWRVAAGAVGTSRGRGSTMPETGSRRNVRTATAGGRAIGQHGRMVAEPVVPPAVHVAGRMAP